MSGNNQTNNNDGAAGDQTKLYAGKFKTIEELESGYKNSAIVYDENETLKKQLEEKTKVPDVYQNPADIEIDSNRVADIQARAKEAGMTQAQYEKFLRSDKARVDQYQQSIENAKKEVGEATINILTDYVNKHYPKELHENMLKTFIVNKDARQAALKHRDDLLNNRVPGVNNVAAIGYKVTDEDIKKAYDQKEKTKSVVDITRYTNLIAQRAAQRNA